MSDEGRTPGSHGERLERAIRWLDAQPQDNAGVVEEACRRFDLSPVDEELLQAMWRRRPPRSGLE